MSPVTKILGRSWRGRFPFRLGTTSFILPQDYLPNVRALAPLFDEVELLFFETPAAAHQADLVTALAAVSEETGLGYNVHLPVDLPLCHPQGRERRRAAAALAELMAALDPLNATALTLHLPYTPPERHPQARRRWQAWVRESLEEIYRRVPAAAEGLTLENLDYPLEWLEAVIEEFDLKVCLDLGHLALAGADPLAAYRCWASRCPLIHLHAAVDGRDHLPLDRLGETMAEVVLGILEAFTGTVSLEVFSLDALHRSTAWLETRAAFLAWPAQDVPPSPQGGDNGGKYPSTNRSGALRPGDGPGTGHQPGGTDRHGPHGGG